MAGSFPEIDLSFFERQVDDPEIMALAESQSLEDDDSPPLPSPESLVDNPVNLPNSLANFEHPVDYHVDVPNSLDDDPDGLGRIDPDTYEQIMRDYEVFMNDRAPESKQDSEPDSAPQLPLRQSTGINPNIPPTGLSAFSPQISFADRATIQQIYNQLSQHWKSIQPIDNIQEDDETGQYVLEWCDQLVHRLILGNRSTSAQLIQRVINRGHTEQSFVEFVNEHYNQRRYQAMINYATSKKLLFPRSTKKIGFRKNYAPIMLYYHATVGRHCSFVLSDVYTDTDGLPLYEIHVRASKLLSFYNAFTQRTFTGVDAKYIRLRLSNYGISCVIHPVSGDLYMFHRDIQPQRLVYLMWQHASVTTYSDRRKAREEKHAATVDQLRNLRNDLPDDQKQHIPVVRDTYRNAQLRTRTRAVLPSRSYVRYLYEKYKLNLQAAQMNLQAEHFNPRRRIKMNQVQKK
jgi:hypothetical protein